MKSGKRRDMRGTFGAGKGVYLSDELRESAAYKSLTASEKLVLADFIRRHYRVSSGDKTDIRRTGFAFTYQDTLEAIDSKTFYRARARICAAGFFARADSLKQLKPGAMDVFIPSADWRHYTPDTAMAQRIETRQGRKEAYIERCATRKRDYARRRGGVADE